MRCISPSRPSCSVAESLCSPDWTCRRSAMKSGKRFRASTQLTSCWSAPAPSGLDTSLVIHPQSEFSLMVNLFTFVDLYDRALDTASHLLTKGVDFAKERRIPEPDMLGWRLIEDMHPLGFQIMVVTNFARQWPARAAGLPVPTGVG